MARASSPDGPIERCASQTFEHSRAEGRSGQHNKDMEQIGKAMDDIHAALAEFLAQLEEAAPEGQHTLCHMCAPPSTKPLIYS
jgi:hypothetical protein